MQNLPTLNNQLSSNDLFNAFKRQLIKDFEQSNFPADFVAALKPEYSSIHEKIAQELQRPSTGLSLRLKPNYKISIKTFLKCGFDRFFISNRVGIFVLFSQSKYKDFSLRSMTKGNSSVTPIANSSPGSSTRL